MSYSAKQLANAYADQSKAGLKEMMLLGKIFSLKSFQKVFLNPGISIDKKQTIIKDLLAPNFSQNSIKFIGFLLTDGTLKNFPKFLSEFKKILRDKKIVLSGTVTSTSKLSEEEILKQEKDLTDKMSVPVVLENLVRPELLGGVILEVEGQVFDNSFKHKLDRLKQ